MLASVLSATLVGVDGQPVRVEAHVARGLPGYTVVGLPDATCRESRDRVRAAVESSGLTWPSARLTVSLTPPGVRKVGSGLDLPIALAVLVAADELAPDVLTGRAALGELGLDGSLRQVSGALPLISAVTADEVILPSTAVPEARLVGRHRIRTAADLGAVVRSLRGEAPWPELPPPVPAVEPTAGADMADVRGQPAARFALEVAAAGGHHLLMVGAPGSGKTMLAQRLPGLLPPLARDQALEVTRIHSAAGVPLPAGGLILHPPYRNPHHGASAVSLVGGGSAVLQPGDLSLAHRGVLFMDELGEFSPMVLENLRQPLEEGAVRISRAAGKVTMPARVLLVAAMNPCPCGEGGPPGACRCAPQARQRYARRLSVPLLDRFDLRVEVGRPEPAELLAEKHGEPSHLVRDRVLAARARARERGAEANAELNGPVLEEVAPFDPSATDLVEQVLRAGAVTGRGLASVRRVALTVADLGGQEPPLTEDQVSAALALRADLSDVVGRVW